MEMELSNGIRISDSDVVNPDDFIPKGEYNPHNVRPFVIHDSGFVLAVVFASHEGDAIDEAVNRGKLDRFLITEADRADYLNEDGTDWDLDRVSLLGNASEPFDIETLDMVELQNPHFSFVALLEAERNEK